MKNSRRISKKGRLVAGLIFATAVGAFALVHWAAVNDRIAVAWLFGPCGFKQKWGLPCPTCGMTTALIAFGQGDIFRAFYIQPAAAVFCSLVVVSSLLLLVMAVFGTDLGLLNHLGALKTKYILIAVLVIIASAWAVTITRTVAQKNRTTLLPLIKEMTR